MIRHVSEAKTLSAARETSKVSSLYSWGLGGAVGLPPMGPVRSPGKFRILENPFWSSELQHQWVNSYVYQVLWILSSDKILTLPSLSRCYTCEEPQSLPFLVLSTTSFPFSHSKEIDKSNQNIFPSFRKSVQIFWDIWNHFQRIRFSNKHRQLVSVHQKLTITVDAVHQWQMAPHAMSFTLTIHTIRTHYTHYTHSQPHTIRYKHSKFPNYSTIKSNRNFTT